MGEGIRVSWSPFLAEGESRISRSARLILCVALPLMLGAAIYPSRMCAQGTDTALLRGTVTDPTGGVIPGATVTMTNDATQVAEKKTTDVAGRYIFNVLKPASYTTTVEARGFKTVVQ